MKINFDMNIISELTKRDPKNLVERGLKLAEECGETAEAISGYSKVNGLEYKNKSIENVEEECLDTIMVALSIISQVNNNNLSEEKIKHIEQVFETKLGKWEKFNCKNEKKKNIFEKIFNKVKSIF